MSLSDAAPAPPVDAAPAIRCRGLVKRFGELTAVAGVDLDVRRGECFGLLGPNGAGKTTTIEILEGLTRHDEGTVEVLGARWGDGRDGELRARIGIALQETQLSEKLTVEETVRLFRSFYPRGRPVDAVIRHLELDEKRRARVGGLSGGQRQRVALACALVGDPALLFLDEPTTGLDPQARVKLWELVLSFREGGGTVVVTTHYMEEAAQLCDRVAILDHGKVIALGTPDELIASLGAAQLIELEPDVPFDTRGLEEAGVVREVSRRGAGLVLHVGDVASALPLVLDDLGRQRARLRRLTTRQATLDDVFLHLTGKRLRDD